MVEDVEQATIQKEYAQSELKLLKNKYRLNKSKTNQLENYDHPKGSANEKNCINLVFLKMNSFLSLLI